MDANGYLSSLKILYKFYKDLWREVKNHTQKCGLWKNFYTQKFLQTLRRSMTWNRIHTKMRHSKKWTLPSICFFIECCIIFFVELRYWTFIIEAKMTTFASIFNIQFSEEKSYSTQKGKDSLFSVNFTS